MKIWLVVTGKTDAAWLQQGIDLYLKRIGHYLPLEMKVLADLKNTDALSQRVQKEKEGEALLAFQTQRARELMLAGAPLVHQLPGRIGWEIRFTVQGGLRILEIIDQMRGDVFRHRPQLGPFDWLIIGSRALFM